MKSSGEHRRGRSMGSVVPAAVTRAGEKDEDLALFHEMKRREKHNFLHPSPDDLDATLSSKFGGMGAPTKKPGTDLLTSESDKNDYDWLLTPPGTPLFPSLDQEAAALAVLSPALSNGSYSSASSATKSLKSASTYSPAESVTKGSRGNPSPRRQSSTAASITPNGISRSRSSPSHAATLTRPSTPTLVNGGTRPSTPTSKSSSTPSVRASTPNLKLTISHSAKSYSTATTPTGTRPSTPTPRSSTPPVRPSTPGGRSSTPTSKPSTPTMRRSLSGGRSGLTSPSTTTTRGGPSPKRTTSSSSRGNSPSAKRVTSVITSIAGMPSEAPPNLRTTMSERPTSAGKSNISNGCRPGSEAGHNYNNIIGLEDSAQSRRRPRSPSVARSFSSSSSQDQRTSSQTSRGSVISSYDDGLEVNRPSFMGSNRNSSSSAGKWHAAGHEELLGGKANAYAKRATKPSSVASKDSSGFGVTPSKKSSDPVKRQVDAYQNSPTTAYRHLHSSSPVSPFYNTRSNSLLRAGSLMNSSVTTSSNASSEHGTTIAADTEGSERDEDDLLSWDSYGRRASTSPRVQQADILVLDKDDEKSGLWQDSLYERANSNDPSSSHSQGSQSTLDAEVTGFYETDGIASLEMLEQLGLMGENYKFRKSSTFGGRSSEKRASSTEDSKVSTFYADEDGHSKISPQKAFQEGQGTPARHGVQLERQDSSERLRKSRDFETELLRRNGEKSLGLTEPKAHNSEIRAACLFVRDFKVGLSPPRSQHLPLFSKDFPSGAKKQGIEEMEMKLRNELSYDWNNSVDLMDQPTMDPKGDTQSKLSDSPILVPCSSKHVPTLELTPDLNLDDLFIPAAAEDQLISDSLVPPTMSEHVGLTDMRKPELTLPNDLDFEDPISTNNTPASAEIDNLCVNDGVMDESETDLTTSRDMDLDSRIPLEYSLSNAMVDSAFAHQKAESWDVPLSTSQTLAIQSSLNDDGIYVMDEDISEMHVLEHAAIVHGIEEESELLECKEDGHVHVKEEQHGSPMHMEETCISVPENRDEDANEDANGEINGSEFLQAENQQEVADDEGLDKLHYLKPGDEGLPGIQYAETDNKKNVADEEFDRMLCTEADHQQDAVDNRLQAVGDDGQEVANEERFDRLQYAKEDEQQHVADEELSEILFAEEDNEQGVAAEELPGIQTGGTDNKQDVADEKLPALPSVEADNEQDVADKDVVGIQSAEANHEQNVVDQELDEVWSSEADDQHNPVDNMLQEMPLLVREHGQEVSQEEVLDTVQYSKADEQQDLVAEGLPGVRSAEADNEQDVAHEELDRRWSSEGHDQHNAVDNGLQSEPFSVVENEQEGAKELFVHEAGELIIQVQSDELQVSEIESEQGTHIFSNGNHDLLDSEYPGILEKEAVSNHCMNRVLGSMTNDEQSPQNLLQHSDKRSTVDVKETSVEISHAYLDETDDYQESVLNESYNTAGSDDSQMDVLRSGVTWERTQNPEVEPLETSTATSDSLKDAEPSVSNHHVQEESQSLEYFDADCVAEVDDVGEEVSSGLSNHLLQVEIQSLKDSNADSVEELDDLEDASKGEGYLLQKNFPPFSSKCIEGAPNENIDLVKKKLPEPTSWCAENQQMSNGRGDASKIGSNCKPKSVIQFIEKHTKVSDLPHKPEDINELQPSKAEFRSASTLCAALEEQIAGLIQKIDSAIEESSKPFNASPQESSMVKDKRTTLSSEQDDCTGSIRPSQEEDLLDMLWAEDDGSSCSEGSRDQDFLNSKDGSQRDMNGVRSSRLSDRGLAVSLLGQSNDAYDSVVRSSPSDLGVEKHMLEEPSKRCPVPVDQQGDVVHMHTRDPVLCSTNLTLQTFSDSVSNDALVQRDAQSKIEISSIDTLPSKSGVQLKKTYEDLQTVSGAQEYFSDSLTESSSGDEGDDDIKTSEELIALCTSGQQGSVPNNLTSSIDERSSNPDCGPSSDKISFAERSEVDSTNLKENTQEGGGSSEAVLISISHEHVALGSLSAGEQDNGTSNGNRETVEVRDLAIQELAHNRDRDESPILHTLVRSDITSRASNEALNEEWCRKNKQSEEPSSRAVTSLDHVVEKEVPENRLNEKEPQSLKDQEVPQETFNRPSHFLLSKQVDISKQEEAPKVDEEEGQGESSIFVNHDSLPLHDTTKSVEESERRQNSCEGLAPQHDVLLDHTKFGTGAEEKPKSLSGTEIEGHRKVVLSTHDTVGSTGVIKSTQLPDRKSEVHGDQSMRANANADGGEDDLFTLIDETQQLSSQSHGSPCELHGAVRSGTEDELDCEGVQAMQENRMLQEHPEVSPAGLLTGSREESQTEKWKSSLRQTGQHISLIAGDKISRPDRESFRIEEDSGAELGSLSSDMVPTITVREIGSMEPHGSDGFEPVKEQAQGDRTAEGPGTGHQEVTRLSVWSELPTLDFCSVRRSVVVKEEMQLNSSDHSPGANETGDAGTRHDEDTEVGNESCRRLPINKAKSVRTIPSSPRSRTESPSEEPGSPGRTVEPVNTPPTMDAYTNITVISPEKLQWDHSSSDGTPSKTRSSPASLSRSMTLAEATDTILYCSSLMHTIVYKAAAYAIEKEELAALESTPTSNGEVPHYPGLSEVDDREKSDSVVGESDKWNAQGGSTGPSSVRRALSYMGHQTVPVTPADTSLQIPADQVIENLSPANAAQTAIQVHQKDEIMPVKVQKSRCGCSIM